MNRQQQGRPLTAGQGLQKLVKGGLRETLHLLFVMLILCVNSVGLWSTQLFGETFFCMFFDEINIESVVWVF